MDGGGAIVNARTGLVGRAADRWRRGAGRRFVNQDTSHFKYVFIFLF